MSSTIFTLVPISFFTYLAYFYFANRLNIVNLVNQRSSHQGAIVSGAGIVFSLIFMIDLTFRYFQNPIFIESHLFWTFILSGVLFSSIGFMDDNFELSAKNRLFLQALTCLITAFILTPNDWYLYDIWLINYPITLIVVFLYLLSFINFFNFMDGINGLSTIQSLLVLMPLSLLSLTFSDIYLALGIVLLVFLGFNFPKAKMFMGDSGSYFLGVFIATSVIFHTFSIGIHAFFALNTLLIVFWIDPVVTLIFRLFRNENVFEAHREHLYQKISRIVGSHSKTVFLFLIFYILVLVPISYLCFEMSPAVSAIIFLSLCSTLLIIFSFLQLKFKAI